MEKISLGTIKAFIYKKIQEENISKENIDDDVELVESRVISSLLLIQIITGIEDIIEKPLITDDVEIEDFSSINRILRLVEKVI